MLEEKKKAEKKQHSKDSETAVLQNHQNILQQELRKKFEQELIRKEVEDKEKEKLLQQMKLILHEKEVALEEIIFLQKALQEKKNRRIASSRKR